ncbi:unnamed protein product [Blepharisma stoltei]|uniref:Uncharacterized protein n=1 Tax=Blepharisma stoltei TaxID=1481888 RepID=A0AAU9J2L8_9CILI|nr:unnamed protein product [Blepharisma stoltei]
MAKGSSSSVLKEKSSDLEYSGRTFFLIASLIMEFLLVFNIFWSCRDTFDCSTFWPTLSYLACFRGHDRLFNFTLTYFTAILPVFLIISYTHFSHIYGRCFNFCFISLGILITFTLPFISMIDEANSSHIMPLEKIHIGIMTWFIAGVLIWIYMSMLCMRKINIPADRIEWKGFLEKYLTFGITMLGFNIYEYFFAYSKNANWWVNQNVEAVCEWTVISMAVFLPYVYSLAFPNLRISFKMARI